MLWILYVLQCKYKKRDCCPKHHNKSDCVWKFLSLFKQTIMTNKLKVTKSKQHHHYVYSEKSCSRQKSFFLCRFQIINLHLFSTVNDSSLWVTNDPFWVCFILICCLIWVTPQNNLIFSLLLIHMYPVWDIFLQYVNHNKKNSSAPEYSLKLYKKYILTSYYIPVTFLYLLSVTALNVLEKEGLTEVILYDLATELEN